MAKLDNSFPILAALLSSMLAAASMLASPAAAAAAAAEAESPSPSLDDIQVTIPPEPEPGLYHYLEVCTKKMSHKCGENVVQNVFEDVAISGECCGELVYLLGKTCHDDLVQFFASLPELRLNASQVRSKGDQVWDSCLNSI